ncbi:MAG TPA: AAA family ATPase [Oligoflexia bacterium]|nr:AAA family ATPase [Oligoflexia bacterium]HMP47081.1 AAA family ATPase [Oligoflexia bacterium]
MKALIVENSAEGQARCARRIQAFSQSDVEMLDLRIKLVSEKEVLSHLQDAEIIILGSGLGEVGPQIARTAIASYPWLHIVMYVTDQAYSGGAFRIAHSAGVRKVLTDDSSPLDLLQELVSIHSEFRKQGKVKEAKVIVVAHAKGGTGATTITAALGQVCDVYRKQAFLWDLDVETRDLSRSLAVGGSAAQVVTGWVNESIDITRDTVNEALTPVSDYVSVLMPPDSMAEAMDMVCHTDGMNICHRVVELARVMNDIVIIDTAGRIGPACGALMRAADEVLIVIDDTLLGLTALDLYLTYVKALVTSPDKISFLVNGYSGQLLVLPEIESTLEGHQLGSRPWRLPPLSTDEKGSQWPGSGGTFYSKGSKSTRAQLEAIAEGLNIIDRSSGIDETEETNWWERLLPKGSSKDESSQNNIQSAPGGYIEE